MALVPSGHVRVMKGQTLYDDGGLKQILAQLAAESRSDVTQQQIGDPASAGGSPTGAGGDPAIAPGDAQAPTGTPGMTPGAEGQQVGGQPGDQAGAQLNVGHQPQPVDDQKFQNSLTKFVLQKVIQWKWPERLAITKQEEMVDEKIMPDGHRNFTILVPNIYYGGDVISNEDFQRFIQELTQKFGIHFQGAQRKGKKATLNFSTTQKEMQIDPLSDIYGKGSGGGGGGAPAPGKRAAYTMGEMLTARRNDLYETMRKIACQESK